jgi:membrane protease YdiL (CAAX protease family)
LVKPVSCSTAFEREAQIYNLISLKTMQGQLRVQSGWTQLGIFLGLLGGAFILASLLMAGVIMAQGISPVNLDLNDPKVLSVMKWLQGISSILIFLLPALLYASICIQGSPTRNLGFRPAERISMYWLAVLCIFAAFPLVFWLGELNQQLPMPEWVKTMEKDAGKQMEAFLKANSTLDVVINVFVIALLPAFCEEICFRGALQRIIIQIAKNPWVGIVITAILFSALHLQFQGFFPRVMLGIVLGALYWFSGSLWPSILAHFVNNAVQVIAVSGSPELATKNPSMPFYYGLLSAVVVAIILYYYQMRSTQTYASVYNQFSYREDGFPE